MRTFTDNCRAELVKLIDKDFSKYKIEEKMLGAVLEISTFRKNVSTHCTTKASR